MTYMTTNFTQESDEKKMSLSRIQTKKVFYSLTLKTNPSNTMQKI